ncbi:MAG: FHA domain-containing protein, partial [Planctomycetota bacterium]|nr:FHA domain-containing protein [Planctomycetota bacterium]
MIKLQITNKEGDSRILEFEDFPVRIGRESDSEIVTDDSKTSRQHATFEMEEGQLYLCDKGSSNGSFLNSTRIEREVASQGDKVRVGNTRIMIVA